MIALLLAILAQNGAEQEAAAAFHDGRLADARILYDKLLAQPGADLGAIHANLGHCALQSGRPAKALFHYLQAGPRLPPNAALDRARQLAERRLGLLAAAPPAPHDALLHALDAQPPARMLLWISAGLTLGGLGVMLARGRAWVWLPALLVLAGLGAAWRLADRAWLAAPEGLVFDQGAGLRGEPHAGLPARGTLPPGSRVQVLERGDRWLRVRHARDEGWTEAAGIGLLPAGTR